MGYDKSYIESMSSLIENNSKIKQHHGNSLQFDFKKLDCKFDLIFIDGNHSFEYVKSDTIKVFKHLVHSKSIVVWHDLLGLDGDIRYGSDFDSFEFHRRAHTQAPNRSIEMHQKWTRQDILLFFNTGEIFKNLKYRSWLAWFTGPACCSGGIKSNATGKQ